MTDWDARWLDLAREVGGWSKDRSTKVGCLVVGSGKRLLSAGYNGFPRGVNDDIGERHERPAKYKFTEHAERNAIYNAARNGVDLYGTVMYVPWHPCTDCARGIVQSGIAAVVISDMKRDGPSWEEDFAISRVILEEGGVKVRLVKEVDPPDET